MEERPDTRFSQERQAHLMPWSKQRQPVVDDTRGDVAMRRVAAAVRVRN
jgi:hypothetical protein